MATGIDDHARYSRIPTSDLPKSASFPDLPVIKDYAYATARPILVRGDTSLEDLSVSLDSADSCPTDYSSGWTTPSDDSTKASPDLIADATDSLTPTPATSLSDAKRRSDTSSDTDDGLVSDGTTPVRPVTSLRVLRRQSGASSRSVSPQKTERMLRRPSLLRRRSSQKTAEAASGTQDVAQGVKHAPPGSRLRQSLLVKSFSADRLHVLPEAASENLPPLPSSRPLLTAAQRTSSLGSPKKRDELWTVFRALNEGYTKFSTKSTSFKASVIRQSLLPFLREYAIHPSNHGLRAEDLDRRVVVLNKWWRGLLELLHARNNGPLSGTDRPAVLDALSGLMDRPEWRASPSDSSTPAQGGHAVGTTPSEPLRASALDPLTMSIVQNVRNIFEQNLGRHMIFVAEKMSLRNASASLIAFCGKAIAYAFFYCPGVAEFLIKFWTNDANTFRRILTEHGLSKFDNTKAEVERCNVRFPFSIQYLACSTLNGMLRSLRPPTSKSSIVDALQPYGYWNERWSGRDGDLFYVFVKNFYILTNEHLPENSSKKEQISAPGMLLVQAQLLANLDATIHRDDIAFVGDLNTASGNLDDFLGASDAVVSSMPLVPVNATRVMAENRLIMLIRDFLSDRATDYQQSRHLFAQSFNRLLAASARSISIYNRAACYTLCDILEEALAILLRYDLSEACPSPTLDFDLWLDVCKKMLGSQNTVTDIRLFAFLYSAWASFTTTAKAKESLCLDFLLSDQVFMTSYLHWCPMVRAYYMRLVCWRIGRLDAKDSASDAKILSRLAQCLESVWSHHVYDEADAAKRNKGSALPWLSQLMPGRRFSIVRSDMPTGFADANAFLAFDTFTPSPVKTLTPATSQPAAPPSPVPGRIGRPVSLASSDSDSLTIDQEAESGLRSFLRGIMGGSSLKRSQSRRRAAPAQSNASVDSSGSSTPRSQPPLAEVVPPAPPSYRSHSYRFSLEFAPKPQIWKPSAESRTPLSAPRLPPFCESKQNQKVEAEAQRLDTAHRAGSPYVGRALAEWEQVVAECEAFVEKRHNEGVPEAKFVETPALGVEVFRR